MDGSLKPGPGRRRRRALTLGLAALALAAVLAGGLLFWRPWRTVAVPPGPSAKMLSLKGNLEVVVYESAQPNTEEFKPAKERQRLRLFERKALPLRPRDWIRIEATLNEPAYLYLFWIGADGQTAPLWPWLTPDPNRPPAWTDPRGPELPRTTLMLPGDLTPGKDLMPLGESPPGVEALLLLARDTVLSSDEAAELARLLAPQKRRPAKDGEMAVWLENGERVKDAERAPLLGKSQASLDAEEQVRTVMRQIHERFGYVRGVCFGNQGKDKP